MVDHTTPIHIDIKQVSEELKIRPEIYLKIATSFVNSLTGKLNILSDAVSANDRDQMRMTLHEIKGTSGNLRLKNLIEAEGVMHTAVHDNQSQARLSQCFEDLRIESERLQQYMYALNQKGV